MEESNEIKQYRSIFISDVHLATRGCKSGRLLDFLKHHDSEYLYLVGDIIDFWRMKKLIYWPQSHNDVIQKLLRRARKGTQVFFLPGNHDEALYDYAGLDFGEVKVRLDLVHETADGRRFLVLHGDRYDGVVKHSRWLAMLGAWSYDVALLLNHWLNLVRRRLGYQYWSLSAFLKSKVKNAMMYVTSFQLLLAEEIHQRKLDGIICGHLHRAEVLNIDGIQYYNTGDWVENCTAVVEHFDGRLEIVTWNAVEESVAVGEHT